MLYIRYLHIIPDKSGGLFHSCIADPKVYLFDDPVIPHPPPVQYSLFNILFSCSHMIFSLIMHYIPSWKQNTPTERASQGISAGLL